MSGTNGYPLLQKILVGFGDKTVMRDNLPDALRDVSVIPERSGEAEPRGGTTPNRSRRLKQVILQQLAAALAEAQAANEGQAALKNGDFAAYGVAQKKLKMPSSVPRTCRISSMRWQRRRPGGRLRPRQLVRHQRLPASP